jgi:hypothetical protein
VNGTVLQLLEMFEGLLAILIKFRGIYRGSQEQNRGRLSNFCGNKGKILLE